MKTCEEYVLQELEAAKDKIRKLERDYESLDGVNRTIYKFLYTVKKYMFVSEGSAGKRYIEMKYVFEEYEDKDFETLEAMLLLLEDERNG